MRRRLTGIAAVFLVLLTMVPVVRACAMSTMVSQTASAHQECCPHAVAIDTCCSGASSLCHATQPPADKTPLPGHNVSPHITPPVMLAVVFAHRSNSAAPRFTVLGLPWQHAPPGLLIAATTVLRT